MSLKPASTRDLDSCLYDNIGDVAKRGIGPKSDVRYSKTSSVDIFEVRNGRSILAEGLDDVKLSAALKADRNTTEPRMRVIIIDAMIDDADRLPITHNALRLIFDQYKVSPRFENLLWWQHMPGRALHYGGEDGDEVLEHELWYSSVIRSMEHGPQAKDASRQVLAWQRLCAWSLYEYGTGRWTTILFRSPVEFKRSLYKNYQGSAGSKIIAHPMFIHSFVLEHSCVFAGEFQHRFSDFLYRLEEEGHVVLPAHEHTRRAREFLAVSRRLEQITTDYDILRAAIDHMVAQSTWYEERGEKNAFALTSPPAGTSPMTILPSEKARSLLHNNLDNLKQDIELVRSYNRLYRVRSKIGINECFAMVNQINAEVRQLDSRLRMDASQADTHQQNNRAALESASIASASRADNRALNSIQFMTMLFLPASLVSSIFGMGFFNTSVEDDGRTTFTASNKWWLWLAVSVPVTCICFIAIAVGTFLAKRKEQKSNSLTNAELAKTEGAMAVDRINSYKTA